MMLAVPLTRPDATRRDVAARPSLLHPLASAAELIPPCRRCASVELATGLECPLGGAAVNVEAGLHPRKHVAHLRFAAARGQVVNLPHRQFTVPDVKIRQVPNESLCCVESSSEHVLRWRQMDLIEADMISPPRDAPHGENCLCGLEGRFEPLLFADPIE